MTENKRENIGAIEHDTMPEISAGRLSYLMTMKLYCCGCSEEVEPRLTDGREIYPHRPDLGALPFWRCDRCGNFVGCHHKTKNPTAPLGCIPTPEIKEARKHIHRILDPLWQGGKMKRKDLYAAISQRVGWRYHTAKIRSIDEARTVYRIVREISERRNAELWGDAPTGAASHTTGVLYSTVNGETDGN